MELRDECIEMDNAVIIDLPGVLFALHVCRGNNQRKFYASGGYGPIGAKVVRRSRFRRFLLEYDDARSGGFEPLREVPEDRTVVLGLVTTKKGALEGKDELKELLPMSFLTLARHGSRTPSVTYSGRRFHGEQTR